MWQAYYVTAPPSSLCIVAKDNTMICSVASQKCAKCLQLVTFAVRWSDFGVCLFFLMVNPATCFPRTYSSPFDHQLTRTILKPIWYCFNFIAILWEYPVPSSPLAPLRLNKKRHKRLAHFSPTLQSQDRRGKTITYTVMWKSISSLWNSYNVPGRHREERAVSNDKDLNGS